MRIRMHTITALTAAALLALTACGSNDSGTSAAPTSATRSSDADTKPANLDAEQVVKSLAVAISNAKTATVYTADTDPNDLLGRPGGYTSKADFTDDRAKPKLDDEVQNGGSVEVYDDPAEAEERGKFIADMLDEMKIFGTEYHYTKGGILLRVSGALTPEQASGYEAALKKLR